MNQVGTTHSYTHIWVHGREWQNLRGSLQRCSFTFVQGEGEQREFHVYCKNSADQGVIYNFMHFYMSRLQFVVSRFIQAKCRNTIAFASRAVIFRENTLKIEDFEQLQEVFEYAKKGIVKAFAFTHGSLCVGADIEVEGKEDETF